MVRISKISLKQEKLDKIFNLFFLVLGRKQSPDEFMDTIFELMSQTERIMFAKRVAIMFLLEKGIEHVSIKLTLHVSLSTVGKFAILYEQSRIIKVIMQQARHDEKVRLFLEELVMEFVDQPLSHPVESKIRHDLFQRKKSVNYLEDL